MSLERLKLAAIISFALSLVLLLGGGYLAKDHLPPYPGEVLAPDGKVLFTRADILEGQDVYQRCGLMDHGSVWGHGAQRGAEFSAFSLHLSGDRVRNELARKELGKSYGELSPVDQQLVDVKVKNELRTNRYDQNDDKLVLTAPQTRALDATCRHWEELFRRGDTQYGYLPNTIPSEHERLQVGRFFFWTAWVASSFWNFLGAAVFGFLINLPLINYYEHGTYLTMNHGHGALFGVYGMLSIGLLLFSWRGLVDRGHWDDRLLKMAFFGFNIGLLLLTLGTLFPVGVLQTWISYKEALWIARDASFFENPLVQFIGSVCIIPDLTIILAGVLPLFIFLFKTYPHLKAAEIKQGESVWERLGVEL